jgi:DNA-binding NarL/FixJ family response regulator
MDTQQQIRVAIVDDNPRFRKHLVKVLGKQSDIVVVVDAEANPAGINELEKHQPDVILVEGKEPFTDRIESTSLVVAKFPNTRVIVLSIDQENSMLPLHSAHTMTVTASSCQTWACYSLCENCSPKEILAAIREGHQPKNGSVPKNIGKSDSFNQ